MRDNPDILWVAGAEKTPRDWPGDGTANSTVLKSIDGGQTWREQRNGLPETIEGGIEAMNCHTWPGGMTLSFATAKGEIYASDDGGEHWRRVAQGHRTGVQGCALPRVPAGCARARPAGLRLIL